jgi:RND family efflux transporter MFP subunit
MKKVWPVCTLLWITACNPFDPQHAEDHSHETQQTELDQDAGHVLDKAATLRITHFSEETELFLEFPALVMGEQSPFLAHLTRLDDHTPVERGVVTVALIGGGAPDELFTAELPVAPGIFRPLVRPLHAVKRHVILHLQSADLAINHDLGEFSIYPTVSAAREAVAAPPEPEDVIHYLKEQQWQVDFATHPVVRRVLRASIAATGILRPRADGEVYLSASSAGHIYQAENFPYPGMQVVAGQLLANIIPRLAADSDVSTLRATLDKARTQHALAEHEKERLEQLWQDKVIALHRLHEAESALEVAQAELAAAQRRYAQSTGEKSRRDAGIPVFAPISGVLAHVEVAPGRYVSEGEALFHIVNVDRLWLEARIAEADIGRLHEPDGAWFTVEGFDRTFDTFALKGRKIGLGGAVDPVNRTTPLIFEFENPDHRLRSGIYARVRVFTGDSQEGLAVPVSAIFDDAGQEVVYVMLDGETFQRRVVRLGIRDSDWVLVRSGVAPGERVVSEGAYLLRLASAAPPEAGHGHAH